MSETGSDMSFLRKKKKPKKVTNVDFDELFAKGLARSKEMEQSPYSNGEAVRNHYQQVPLSPTAENATTFEMFSKDEAFRKSQKSSGISYAEKVQSYLTDQTTTGHPFDGSEQVQNQSIGSASTQPSVPQQQNKQEQARRPSQNEQNRRTSQHAKVQPKTSPEEDVDALQKRAQELPEDPRTQTTHHRDLAITQASLLPAHENEKKLEESVTATRRSSVIEPGKNTVTRTVSPTASRTSSMRSRRPQTPQEFLGMIQDFVKNSEMDAEFSQPVWPARVSSSKDLPLTKPVTEAFIAKKQEQQAPQISIEESAQLPVVPVPVRRNSYTAVKEQDTLRTPEAPPRQRSPKPGYGAKPRDHSPFCIEGPSVFDECLRNPLSTATITPEREIPLPQLIAPSQGRSYLDKPSTSPDPFGARVEMDAPPSSNQAAAVSSSIMTNLKKEANQRKYDSEMMDDVITLDLRTNQEKLEYLSVPSDYSHRTEDLQASPNEEFAPYPEIIPADRHIPQQLQPDPLTSHETIQYTPSSFGSGYIQQEDGPPIQDTDLYRKLKVGLDRLMSTEKFKTLASQTSLDQQGLEQQSYSQHLGRAEFGDLRKRTHSSTQGITSPGSSGGGSVYMSQQQSRDPSNERPASAMARMAGSERGGRGGNRTNFSSQPNSRDSSFGRHDSRQDEYF